MNNRFSSHATRYLEELGITYRIFVHKGEIKSIEQAAQERGQVPDQIIRSILFRTGKNEYIIVLIAGTRQVSWPALRKWIGRSRITLASEEEVKQVTGYTIGSVSPFGLNSPIRLLVDHSVFIHPEISIGSGQKGIAIILKQKDLQRALKNYEIGDFSAKPDKSYVI